MKKVLLIFLFVACATLTNAQSFGGSLMLGLPQGEFKNNVDRAGFGLQVQATLGTLGTGNPFTVGIEGGYLVYGQISERRAWPGFPGIYLNLSRTNSLANLHLLFQVCPFSGPVKPYIEGLAGGAYLFTQSEVKSESSSNNDPIATSTNFDDFNWSYGGGAGIMIRLSQDLGQVSALYLDLKARYLLGSEAEYLTEESVYVNNLGDTIFTPKKSKTDLLTIHIGVIAEL